MNRIENMRALLEQALAPTRVEITDDSASHAGHAGAASGGGHYNLVVVSAAFAGLAPLARHRRVYEILGGMMGSQIHAVSIRALTPEEASHS